MRKSSIFLLTLIGTILIDQGIKDIFVTGYEWQGSCISLELHYNKGVAFSMLSSLGENLKWLQMVLILGIIVYLGISGLIREYALSMGLLLGGALGNLYDRFEHGGVVDYIYWHCWFDYPVFNYADIVVVIAVAILLISSLFGKESRAGE